MALTRESLPVLFDRMYTNYMSRLKPLDKTARHNLIRVMAEVEAGMYHQLLGDLSFLSDQMFPDTATGDYLRMHWSDRVPPLYAVCALGTAEVKGVQGTAVPAGLVYVSPLPQGLSSEAVTVDGGIKGGVDAESDEDYLSRVLIALRNTARYGKTGDFAAWAVDSSADVSKAFEFKNFGVFGALLIQVISGDHFKGISQVGNLSVVTSYIDSVAPPVMYTVRTPDLKPVSMTVTLLASESTSENQGIVRNRINGYLNASARPGVRYTEGSFRDAIVDGVKISFAQVKFDGNATGEFLTTILEYPVLKEVRFVVK